MKRLVVVLLVVALAVAVLCLGATESLINRSGKTASGVVLTFSESVRITSYDQAVFPNQDPTGRAETFTFSGGELLNGGRFKVTWSPNSAEITSSEWIATTTAAAAGPMGFPTTTATPVVAGTILNPAYFAHAAYVIQGVSDRGKVFALPLRGVPELAFLPTATGIDPASVTWSLLISHPEGIGAEIADDTLYIWGSNAAWAGYGAVTLTVSTGGETGSVTIPVTVFRTDKTLVNAEGKKDYFVPWSPRLDVNRILSTEEHMRQYDKPDIGLLDRTLRFSCWRLMEYLHGATLTDWFNPQTHPGFTQEAVFLQVDNTYRELRRINCDGVNVWRAYHVEAMDSPCPVAIYSPWLPGGPTMTDEELRYTVNEAHLNGFTVVVTPNVQEAPGARDFTPADPRAWLSCLGTITEGNARTAQDVGADFFVVANVLSHHLTIAQRLGITAWNGWLLDTVTRVRAAFSGPVAYMPGSLEVDDFRACLLVLRAVDIVGGNSNFTRYPVGGQPALQEVEDFITRRIRDLIEPIHAALQKPMLVNEGYCCSYRGAIRAIDLSGTPPEHAEYDGSEQAIWYQAWFDSERKFPFLFGFGWFLWSFLPASGGVGDVWASPRLKPAQKVIEAAYGDGSVQPRAREIDGDLGDWAEPQATRADLVGDSADSRLDVTSVRSVADNLLWYFAVTWSGQLPQDFTVGIDIDLDGDGNVDVPTGVFHASWANGRSCWMATASDGPWTTREVLGALDVQVEASSGCGLEMSVPQNFLDFTPNLWVRAVVIDGSRGMEADRTDWLFVSGQE